MPNPDPREIEVNFSDLDKQLVEDLANAMKDAAGKLAPNPATDRKADNEIMVRFNLHVSMACMALAAASLDIFMETDDIGLSLHRMAEYISRNAKEGNIRMVQKQ